MLFATAATELLRRACALAQARVHVFDALSCLLQVGSVTVRAHPRERELIRLVVHIVFHSRHAVLLGLTHAANGATVFSRELALQLSSRSFSFSSIRPNYLLVVALVVAAARVRLSFELLVLDVVAIFINSSRLR